MFETTGDILNLVLAVSLGAVALFLCITLYYLIFVLRDISGTTKVLRKTAKQVDELLVQPTRIITFLFSKIRDVAAIVENRIARNSKKSRKSSPPVCMFVFTPRHLV